MADFVFLVAMPKLASSRALGGRDLSPPALNSFLLDPLVTQGCNLRIRHVAVFLLWFRSVLSLKWQTPAA